MVMKTPAISGEIVARMSVEQVRLADGQVKANEAYHKMLLRQWCIEQAVEVCGQELGIMWYGAEKYDQLTQGPPMKCCVVPIAEEILKFITSS